MKRLPISPLSLSISALVLTAVFSPRAEAQTTRTYDGGGSSGVDIGTAVNWSGDLVPDVVAGDTGQFDGTLAGNLSLIYSDAAFAGASGNSGINLSLLGGQTGALNIDSGANSSAFRVKDITIASGAGAFSFGDGSNALNLTLGGATGTTHTFTNNSSNTATLNSDVAFSGLTGAQTLAITGTGNWAMNNAISNGGGTSLAITKSGAGSATFGGTLSHTGLTKIDAGTVTITGTGTNIGAIDLAKASTSSILNFASTGTVSLAVDKNLNVGGGSTSGAGVINHTAGTLTLSGTGASTTTGNLQLGFQDSSYGAYNMSGGTLNVNLMRNGGIGGGNGSSVFYQTGGTVNTVQTIVTGRSGTGPSVFLMDGAGAAANVGSDFHISFHAGYAVATINSGTLNVTNAIKLAEPATATAIAIFNVNGGFVSVGVNTGGSIGSGAGSATSGSTRIVNLNGATLQAKANTTQFIANLTRANIYSGGVTIDSNAKTITIPQALLTASGSNGIASIPITAGGSGYIGAPVVTIAGGGGIGATAAATVSGGVVTGITITSAGTGYTSAPTITLTGGGATTPATLGTALFAANASDGGLTKIGLGTLTLSGANTYTGTTTVNSGVLATTTLAANGTASGLGQGTTVTLDGGTLKYTGTTSVTSGNFNRTINVGPNGATMDNASGAGRFIFVDGSFNGSGPLNFVDSSLNKDQFLVTSGSPSFSGNVVVGNGSTNSGMLQYRSANTDPFGTGIIQINGGILTADTGSTTPTTLGNNLILNGGTVGTQQPNMAYTGPVTLQASSTVGHPYVGSVGTVTFSGGISGGSTAALNVSTASSVILSSANSYSGATTVSAGTLNAEVSGSLGGTSAISVNSGGTLALSGIGVDRINNLADVTLAAGAAPGTGGIFNTGGLNEGPVDGLLGSQPAEMGVLTLGANSTIDFSSLATVQGSNLLFSNLSYVGGDAVRILNWTGLPGIDNGSAGNDRLLFTLDPGFSSGTLASIQFFDDAGGLFATGATLIPFNGYSELVPVPEPSSWMFVGIALLGLVGCKRRRSI